MPDMEKLVQKLNRKPYRPFFNLLVPRKIRKRWQHDYADMPLQREVAADWHATINDYMAGKLPHYEMKPKKDLGTEKIVWQYWAQGFDNLPPLVKLGFDSVDKYCRDWQIIRLTDQTIADYIDLPDFTAEKRKNPDFRTVFFSDLLRIALLRAYGGLWLDATVLLSGAFPEKYLKHEMFMYSRDPDSPNKHMGYIGNPYFNWNESFQVRFLSSIMYAQKGSASVKVIFDLLMHYWKTQDQIKHYFFMQIMFLVLKSQKLALLDLPAYDDTLPHLLHPLINKKFDANRLSAIRRQTSVHKLSWRKKPVQKDWLGRKTFYGHLFDNQ